jgi:hypothetical protein
VTNHEFVRGGDILTAIPPAGSRFNGRDVNKGCYGKDKPACDVVDKVILFQVFRFYLKASENRNYLPPAGIRAMLKNVNETVQERFVD